VSLWILIPLIFSAWLAAGLLVAPFIGRFLALSNQVPGSDEKE